MNGVRSAPGAVAVVLDDQHRVLLHRRRDFFVWALPGGGVERGETGETAAIREVREETGYEIAVTRFVGERTRPQIDAEPQLVYLARVVGGVMIPSGPETRAVKWFPVTALPLSLPTLHRLIIREAISNGMTPIKKTLRLPPVEALLIRLARRLFERHKP